MKILRRCRFGACGGEGLGLALRRAYTASSPTRGNAPHSLDGAPRHTYAQLQRIQLLNFMLTQNLLFIRENVICAQAECAMRAH